MENLKIKVLIVEDDTTIASSLKEALTKEGAEVLVAHKPDQALNLVENQAIGLMYVDLMLPQISGQDFVSKVRVYSHAAKVPVVLMSGIFTDHQSINEAKSATGAVGFLKKPFDLKEALAFFQVVLREKKGKVESPRKKLYKLTAAPASASTRGRIRLIESLEEVHGYDLPAILSVLIEAQASGHLNIVDENNQVSGISLREGHVVGVDVADQETFLGQILKAGGFIIHADLEESLKIKSEKKIGQKLIHENVLSPHAFDWALQEQLTIRLSKVLAPGNIQINFSPSEMEHDGPSISPSAFSYFLHDWIASKIPVEWLRVHYRSWLGCKLIKGPHWSEDSEIMSWPLFTANPELKTVFLSGKNLGELLEKSGMGEKVILKALHLAYIKGVFAFEEQTGSESEPARIQRLTALYEQMKDKNPIEIFELMGGRPSSKQAEKSLALDEFIEHLGPKPDVTSLVDLKKIYAEVMNVANQAYQVIVDDQARAKIEMELSDKEMAKEVLAQSQFDEAKALMSKGQTQPAIQLLRK
ncbi:MAG: response regulator, partial [Pseudobdellovibrionaceae bacterium]